MTQTCSAGYSETTLPASRASSLVHRPAASTTVSASIVPRSVSTPVTRAVLDAEPRDRHAVHEPGPAVVRALREGERGMAGVHRAVGGEEHRPDQVVDVRDGPQSRTSAG